MTGHEPGAVPLRSRLIMETPAGPDAYVTVEHAYAPEGSHDPGRVGLAFTQGKKASTALLSPEGALLLANRLTRAANLALESREDGPDLEREVARFALDVPPQRDS